MVSWKKTQINSYHETYVRFRYKGDALLSAFNVEEHNFKLQVRIENSTTTANPIKLFFHFVVASKYLLRMIQTLKGNKKVSILPFPFTNIDSITVVDLHMLFLILYLEKRKL